MCILIFNKRLLHFSAGGSKKLYQSFIFISQKKQQEQYFLSDLPAHNTKAFIVKN
jgi:hypothetical protein